MSLSPEYASDISSEFRAGSNVNALSLPVDTLSPLRRSGRSRSNEQDSPVSDSKAKRMRPTNLRLPRGVQRQSRNGAAYSGWVTVEGYRPTAELASQDRERLAEAKLIGGLPEARKVIQQLHAEVASTRRIKSQYLTNLSPLGGVGGSGSSAVGPAIGGGSVSAIMLRSMATAHLSPLTRNLPKSVCVISPCGSRDMWFLRSDKLYASFTPRTDLPLETGVFVLEFGATRQTVDEARRDAEHVASSPVAATGAGVPSTAESSSLSAAESDSQHELSSAPGVGKEELLELGSTAHKITQQQESVWGYCAVAELVLENKTAFVGVCVFCDVVLTAGPARGSKSSAETDAFMMVSDVLASGISYAATNYVLPTPNPAEDIFVPSVNAGAAGADGAETVSEEAATEEEYDVVGGEDEEDVARPEIHVEAPVATDSEQDETAPIETPTGASQGALMEQDKSSEIEVAKIEVAKTESHVSE